MKKEDNDQHVTTGHDHHHHHDHHGGHHHFRGIDVWVARLDSPEREQKQRPQDVITRPNLRDDDVIADIGTGTGYFALRIAERYPHVRVIAADAQREMIDYLTVRAKTQNLTNLEPLVIHPARPSLPVKAALPLMVDTLHHIADGPLYLSHLKESMASGARIAVIDYRTDAPEGPPDQHRISKDDAALLVEAGSAFVVGCGAQHKTVEEVHLAHGARHAGLAELPERKSVPLGEGA